MQNELSYEAILFRTDNKEAVDIALDCQQKANKYFTNAVKLFPQYSSYYNYRLFLHEYKNIYWYDKKNREQHKRLMRKIGFQICNEFGCRYGFNGERYYIDCPIKLINIDLGFSMRGSEKYICSICGKSPVFCNHMGVGLIDNVVCKKIVNKCNICCADWGECDHLENMVYSHVNPKKIVVDIDVVTFDVVDDPEDPFCRITKIFYPRDYIEKMINSNEFVYGKNVVYCNDCIINNE